MDILTRPEIFAIKVGSDVKLPQILHAFGHKFFQGQSPEVLGCHPNTDHVAKFHGDWLRELGIPCGEINK